jgi:hypothetical protein
MKSCGRREHAQKMMWPFAQFAPLAHTYIHTYTRTYIHTYIRTYIRPRANKGTQLPNYAGKKYWMTVFMFVVGDCVSEPISPTLGKFPHNRSVACQMWISLSLSLSHHHTHTHSHSHSLSLLAFVICVHMWGRGWGRSKTCRLDWVGVEFSTRYT